MYFPGSQTYCAPSQIQWPGSHEYPGNGGGAFSASGAGGGVVTMASGDGGGPRSPACAIISPGSAAGLALLASADEAKPVPIGGDRSAEARAPPDSNEPNMSAMAGTRRARLATINISTSLPSVPCADAPYPVRRV
jgi:hypothetical protein